MSAEPQDLEQLRTLVERLARARGIGDAYHSYQGDLKHFSLSTKAAILRGVGQDFEVTELDLDPPKAGEVLIRYVAAGLCHSDEHLRHGDIVPRFPMVGGHEGAGIIEEVGEGVTRLQPGDHVICSFLPVCGHCRWCSTGKSNLCDLGANLLVGCMPDGTMLCDRPVATDLSRAMTVPPSEDFLSSRLNFWPVVSCT